MSRLGNRPIEVSISYIDLESTCWGLNVMSQLLGISQLMSQFHVSRFGINQSRPQFHVSKCRTDRSVSQFHVYRLVSTSWCLNFMSWFRVDRLMSQFHVSTRNRHVTNTLCGRACGGAKAKIQILIEKPKDSLAVQFLTCPWCGNKLRDWGLDRDDISFVSLVSRDREEERPSLPLRSSRFLLCDVLCRRGCCCSVLCPCPGNVRVSSSFPSASHKVRVDWKTIFLVLRGVLSCRFWYSFLASLGGVEGESFFCLSLSTRLLSSSFFLVTNRIFLFDFLHSRFWKGVNPNDFGCCCFW